MQPYSGDAARQEKSSASGRRCPRCSLIVRRLQGLLSSKPGDALRAPSGTWPQPVLRVPSKKSHRTRGKSVSAHAPKCEMPMLRRMKARFRRGTINVRSGHCFSCGGGSALPDFAVVGQGAELQETRRQSSRGLDFSCAQYGGHKASPAACESLLFRNASIDCPDPLTQRSTTAPWRRCTRPGPPPRAQPASGQYAQARSPARAVRHIPPGPGQQPGRSDPADMRKPDVQAHQYCKIASSGGNGIAKSGAGNCRLSQSRLAELPD